MNREIRKLEAAQSVLIFAAEVFARLFDEAVRKGRAEGQPTEKRVEDGLPCLRAVDAMRHAVRVLEGEKELLRAEDPAEWPAGERKALTMRLRDICGDGEDAEDVALDLCVKVDHRDAAVVEMALDALEKAKARGSAKARKKGRAT